MLNNENIASYYANKITEFRFLAVETKSWKKNRIFEIETKRVESKSAHTHTKFTNTNLTLPNLMHRPIRRVVDTAGVEAAVHLAGLRAFKKNITFAECESALVRAF